MLRRFAARPLRRLSGLGLLVFDVDGVLTTGHKHYLPDGSVFKTFDARDGLGVYLLVKAGLVVAWVTLDSQQLVVQRAKELDVTEVVTGVADKATTVRRLAQKYQVHLSDTLYMGDDLWDVPAFRLVGVSASVPDAPSYVRNQADYVTKRQGGNGAVREVADLVLRAKGIDSASLLAFDIAEPTASEPEAFPSGDKI